MNRLNALRAKGAKFDIRGVEIDVKSMTFPETTHFAELADEKKTGKALDYMLYVTLRKGIPTVEEDAENGMTDDELRAEINVMDGMAAMEIVKKVQEVSGISSGESEKKDLANEIPPKSK